MNISTIKTQLIGLIGWRQNPNPTGDQLSELTASSSGIYFNDQHPLLTHENLLAISEEDEHYSYTDWVISTTYEIGDIVSYASINYISIKAGSGQQPNTATTYWSVYYRYEAWLKERTEAGIIAAIDDWFTAKMSFRTARNLLQNDSLFSEIGNVTETITGESKIVGIEVIPKMSKSLIFNCYKIGLQFSANQTINIKLFESGQLSPISTTACVYDQSGSVQWFDIDLELSDGKKYYLAYDQDDITGTAINGIYGSDYSYRMGRYFNASAFYQTEGITTMWDTEENTYSLNTNYGINLKFTVKCDYTNFIVDQKDLFKTAIAKRVAMNLLREILYNSNARVNRLESNIDDTQLLYELDGASESTKGNNRSLAVQYEKDLKAIQFDLTGIDKYCLPCRKRGVKYGSV